MSAISGGVFDHPGKLNRAGELEARSSADGFWNDPQAAAATMREISHLRAELESWDQLEGELADVCEMAELSDGESDFDAELESALTRLSDSIARRRFELAMSGEHDSANALLAINPGAGGTESQDWADMLLRMYLRWGERRGYEVEVLDLLPAGEAGIKSVTLRLAGRLAFGYLKSEHGVHRLVRISPFDSGARRHTSFARVEVLPEIGAETDLQIPREEVRVDTYRAGGAGGQHVNKTDSAVRLTHIPTGITATCQNSRSQIKNRETAWKLLAARLLRHHEAEREAERSKLAGQPLKADFGNQIRSYVLHPYRSVKDLRSGYETSDAAGVLDGDLDDLIDSYLGTISASAN